MDRVKFGVLGLGLGYNRAREIANKITPKGELLQTDGGILEAVCDIDSKRLGEATEELHCKGYYDFDEMLDDDSINVIYVATPSGTHLDFAEKAASAGKHVITTKPMETTVDRCERMIKACESNDVQLIVDFPMRYVPQLQQWKAALSAGEFGDIVFAEVRLTWWRSQEYYDAHGGWRGTWRMDGGGSLTNQGIHVVDAFVWLCGDPIEVTAARSDVLNHNIETEDFTTAILKLNNGKPGVVTTTTCHHQSNEWGMSVAGTLGSASNLTVGGFNGPCAKFENDGRTNINTAVPNWPRSAVEDMIHVLCKGDSPYLPGKEGIRSIQLVDQIYRVAGVR